MECSHANIKAFPNGDLMCLECGEYLDMSGPYPVGVGFLCLPPHGWDCFHCGQHFEPTYFGQREAQYHFGFDDSATPACKLDRAEQGILRLLRNKERDLENLQARVNAEDTEKDREMARMASDHGQALRREEEKGYARGIKDWRQAQAEHFQQVLGDQRVGVTGTDFVKYPIKPAGSSS
jgi:hypothetical protein